MNNPPALWVPPRWAETARGGHRWLWAPSCKSPNSGARKRPALAERPACQVPVSPTCAPSRERRESGLAQPPPVAEEGSAPAGPARSRI